MEVRSVLAIAFHIFALPQAELRARRLQKAPPRETQCCRCSVRCPQRTGPMAPQGHRRRLLHGPAG